MSIKRLYRYPVDSAKHTEFKMLCLEYFTYHDKLMTKPSRRYAERARKALQKIKKVAHARGMELLSLYASSMNQGKTPITGLEKQNSGIKGLRNDHDSVNNNIGVNPNPATKKEHDDGTTIE